MKTILFILCIGVCYITYAQEIKPVKVTVEQGIPGESFSKTTLGITFWIQEQEEFIYLDQIETKVQELNTDQSINLLEAHHQAVADHNKYVAEQEKKGRHMFSSRTDQLIDFKASKPLRDTLGFKFVLDSWAIPPKNTKNIYCKALLNYFVADANAEVQSSVTKNVVLNDVNTIAFNNKEVAIQQNGYESMNNEKSWFYELSTSELEALIEKIEQVDDTGKVIRQLSNFKANSRFRFKVSENKLMSPIHLKFTYRPLKQKSIVIDQKLELGL